MMLSDRSSAPTLLGCRPSARNSIGRSQKRFKLLTKRIFCSLHHENNHSFKANSLLTFSCPHRYVGRGPDTMIVAAGDVLRTRLGRYPNFDTVKPPPYFTSVYGITVNNKKNYDVRLRQRHQTVGLYLNR